MWFKQEDDKGYKYSRHFICTTGAAKEVTNCSDGYVTIHNNCIKKPNDCPSGYTKEKSKCVYRKKGEIE